MASKANSRPMRPTPSRRSNFLAETPTVIYSRSAADFRPPADYIGPRKSFMQRLPDPSMNPKKSSLPIISVSKLDIQMAAPPSSKTSLPRIDAATGTVKSKPYFKKSNKLSNKFLECVDANSILRNMPSSFRQQFRSELKNKRPMKGNPKGYVHWDFHNPAPPEIPNLNGILRLIGSHRVMVQEVQIKPGTPPPISGRRHGVAQTDTYLEDIADNETGFISTEMQCEPIYDEPLEAPPLNFEDDPNLVTTGTQLDQWTFSDIDHAFDELSTNLADAVIMESLKQLQEEFELEALRKQHEYHRCLRNREISILSKYKQAQKKYEEQKRTLESRQPWEETLDQIIQLVGFDKIRDIAPLHFIGSQTNQAVFEHIQETVVPPLNEDTTKLVAKKKSGRNILDNIIEDSVLKREAEYAGKMYIRDPKKKGSLATESLSRQSLEYDEEWLGEYGEYGGDVEMMLDDYELTLEESGNEEDNEEEGGNWTGEAWDDINGKKRRNTGSSSGGSYNQQGYDDDDDY